MTTTEERFEPVNGLAPRPMWIGRTRYDVPATARAVHPSRERLGYVLDAAGRVHILLESGSIEAPPELAAQLTQEFFSETPPG